MNERLICQYKNSKGQEAYVGYCLYCGVLDHHAEGFHENYETRFVRYKHKLWMDRWGPKNYNLYKKICDTPEYLEEVRREFNKDN